MKKTGWHAKVDKALIGILLLSLLLRLFYITEPFSGHHSEKEVITASAARLLMGEQLPIAASSFYDMSIKHYGEFILYLTKSMFSIFGIHEWAVRLPMVLFAVSSVYLAYLTGIELFDRRTALSAGFMLAISPLHAYFGRVLIPEGPIVFFMLFSILYFHRWIKSGKTGEIAVSSLMMALAIHQKFTAIYLFTVYVLFLLIARPRGARWGIFTAFSLLAAALPFVWKYLLYWYPAPLYTVGAADYGILLTLAYYQNLAIFFAWGLSPLIALAALYGLFYACKASLKGYLTGQMEKSAQSHIFIVIWFGTTLLSILGTGKWGFMHDYYLLTLVPPAVFIASLTITRLPKRYRKSAILLLLLNALPIIYYINYIEYPDAEAGRYLYGKALSNESIIGSGTAAYYAEANAAPFWTTDDPVGSLREYERAYSVRYIAYPQYLVRLHSAALEGYLDENYSPIKKICSRPSFGYNLNAGGNASYSISLQPKPKCILILEKK